MNSLFHTVRCRQASRLVLATAYSWHYQWACALQSGLSMRELAVPIASVLLRFARERLRRSLMPAMAPAPIARESEAQRMVVLAGVLTLAHQLGACASVLLN